MYPIHKYNLCRLCLFVGDQLMNIFEENESIDFVAQEAIEDLLQFKVVKDGGYPWLVCASCLSKLTEFRLFKRRCIECKITFEQRYENAEESDAIEIRPEEMQIKEEAFEQSPERDEIEDEGEAESRCEGGREEDEEEFRIGRSSSSRMECEDDVVKTETREEEEERGAQGSRESVSAEDVVEVSVEEVHIKDDPGDTTRGDEEETVIPDLLAPPAIRNRLTVCDGSMDFARTERSTGIDGGREEFMCAICEEVFLDLHSLKGHMPCRGPARQWGGENANRGMSFPSSQPMAASAVGVSGGGNRIWCQSLGDQSAVADGTSRPVTGSSPGLTVVGQPGLSRLAEVTVVRSLAGRPRGALGRRPGRVARPRNVKSNVVIGPKMSENFRMDKTVSYQCDMCRHGFSRLDKLKKHIQSHSEEGGYACPICKKSFRTRWSLKSHRKSHQKVTQYECPICGRKFSRPQHLEAHRATHGTGTEYQCGICRKTFPQSSYLEMHLRAHERDDSTQCHICGKRFSEKNVLKVHLRVHMDIKPFECDVCHKRFAQRAALKHHALTHAGSRIYTCEQCQQTFTDEVEMKRHVAAHSGKKLYQCQHCGKTYIQNKSLLKHLEGHKPPGPEFKSQTRDLPSRSIINVKVDPVPKTREELDLSHLPVTITRVKPDTVPREKLDSGMVRKEELIVKTFPVRAEPEPETESKPSFDPVSGSAVGGEMIGSDYSTQDELSSSSRLEPSAVPAEVDPLEVDTVDRLESGTRVRPYKCQICHKCFEEKSELSAHHKLHSESNPTTCSMCGSCFAEGGDLRKHMLVHMDRRPFECPFCAKAFTLRKNLKRHLELDSCLKRLDLNAGEAVGVVTADQGSSWGSQDDGTTPNRAEGRAEGGFRGTTSTENSGGTMNKTLEDIMAAAKEASVEVYLEQEGSVSRVFPCTFCDKTFLRTDQLKKHLMVHGGIKPHACTMCSRRFTEKGNLSKHMKTHAYEKPYPCAFCEKSYTQKKNLERHLLSHQEEDEPTG